MKIVATDKGDTIDLSLDRVSAAILLDILEKFSADDFDHTEAALEEIKTVQNAAYAELSRTSGL